MKHLIFDFDGVLGDTNQARIEVIKEIDFLSEEEILTESRQYWMQSTHMRSANLSAETIKKNLDWSRKFGEAMVKKDFPLFDDFLKEIAGIEDTRLAVVSSGSEIYIKPNLENSGLKFTHILTFEDDPSKEEKVERICRDWGVPTKDAYFFTDTVSDVRELENLIDNDKMYGCSWGYQGRENLSIALDNEHILNNFEDIRRIFGED